MQLNESKSTLKDEIDAIFHISTDLEITFKEAIYPIVKAFETALNRDLLLEKEKNDMFFAFDTKEFVKASLVERYNAYKVAKETGFMTLNEIRRAENLNHIEGLDIINVGLSAVLYDTKTQSYFTPNTGEKTPANTENQGQDLLNPGADDGTLEERYNKWHDKHGRFTAPPFSVTVSAYIPTLKEAKESQEASKRWRVDAPEEKQFVENHPGVKTFRTNGGSTVAISGDSDIVGVCKKRDDNFKGSDLMRWAVENGGRKLDSFEGNHKFYTRCGFEPIARCAFDVQFAPDGWNEKNNDKEDIIFYIYTGEKKGTRYKNVKKDIPLFKSYDEAKTYRDKILEEQKDD